MEFTEAEFQILDLISEDAYGLVELTGLTAARRGKHSRIYTTSGT